MGQTYKVEARVVAPGESEVTAEGEDASVHFDSSADGDPSLFGPAELLTAAFAACLLKNVERFAGLLPFRYRGAAVTVIADREETPPRFSRIRYVLRLDTGEPQERVDLLHRNLISHGTVFNTLARACDVEGEVVIEQAARAGP